MLIMTIKRSDPEKIYTICRNIAATTAEVGEAAAFDYGIGGEANGVDAKTPVADSLWTTVGVWSQITARSNYGRVQVYGHAPNIRFGGSTAIPGTVCKAVAGASYFTPLIMGNSAPGQNSDYDSHLAVVICGSTMNTPAAASTGLRPGFIKAI